MQCPRCGTERDVKDFLGNEICYKCTYREKVGKTKKRIDGKKCAMCDKQVPNNRVLYCSEVCKDERDRIRSLEKYYEKKQKILKEGYEE